MTRTVFYTATTLDGFLATDDDRLDWLFDVPGGEADTPEFRTFLDATGVLVMGSATYEWVVREQDLLAHPETWPAYYGDRPVFVFSSRPLPAVESADIRFVNGSVAEHWATIEAAAADRNVWVVGGGDLAGQFADAGHLDELVVTFAPATLGSGKPLLPRRLASDRLTLRSVGRAGPFAELIYDVSTPAGAAAEPTTSPV